MNLERPSNKSESQVQLEKLQSLSRKEQLVLFDLAYRLGVTPKKETTTNFLSQLHPDHLAGLSEKWQEVSRAVNDQGMDIASLTEEEIEPILMEVLGEQQ